MASVAWAEPTSIITSLADRHTTQVGAYTQHNEPFRLLDSVTVGLWVAELLPVEVLGFLDLVAGAVADEDGLASPLDDNVLAFGDGGEVDLDLGLSQDIGGGGHVYQEVYIAINQPLPFLIPLCYSLCSPCTVFFAPNAERPPNAPTMKYWNILLVVSLPPRYLAKLGTAVVSCLPEDPRLKGDLYSACEVEASVAARFCWTIEVEERSAGTCERVADRTSDEVALEESDMLDRAFEKLWRRSGESMGGGCGARRRDGKRVQPLLLHDASCFLSSG